MRCAARLARVGVPDLHAPRPMISHDLDCIASPSRHRGSFVDATNNDAPLVIDRTFITFYDLDDSKSGLSECLQMHDTSGVFAVLDDNTQLAQVPAADVSTIQSAAAGAFEGSTLDPSLPLFCSTEQGKGMWLRAYGRSTHQPAAAPLP